ncbi:conserved uncharacterized mitochondrial protein [Andalucia godoyi]|uniref:Conserved uncharacterized mitochondrial protein n=1 Tax=Andalucia godoyi TaxID=505711 RepID=A0A8K0F111_ANDGO|nr:conserved uncharacterized mitochondrial protein [Andalucia godoyi]|eukprot:ANDGO_04404.mRNA.1 conserved uncharacterized mitochondrial protein
MKQRLGRRLVPDRSPSHDSRVMFDSHGRSLFALGFAGCCLVAVLFAIWIIVKYNVFSPEAKVCPELCYVFDVDVSERAPSLASVRSESFATSDPLSKFSKTMFAEFPDRLLLFAVLLPVRSEILRLGSNFFDQLMVKYFGASFCRTLSDESLHYFEYRFYVGYDFGDPVLDSVSFQDYYEKWLVQTCPSEAKVSFAWIPLYGLQGRINAIWNILSKQAYADGAHFYTPMNDDVEIFTKNWAYRHAINLIEHPKLPGFGISVFHDQWMPNFPTFHVVSRIHMNIFSGSHYPISFRGANNDPWIFTLYSVLSSAVNNSNLVLRNRVGGTVNRYEYGDPDNFDGMVKIHIATVSRFLRRTALLEPWDIDKTVRAYSFACVEMIMERFDDAISEKSCPALETVSYRPMHSMQ